MVGVVWWQGNLAALPSALVDEDVMRKTWKFKMVQLTGLTLPRANYAQVQGVLAVYNNLLLLKTASVALVVHCLYGTSYQERGDSSG